MKTPSVLLDLGNEDFDSVTEYYKRVDTERDLYEAMRATRQEFGGLPLKEVADTMKKVYGQEEIDAICRELILDVLLPDTKYCAANNCGDDAVDTGLDGHPYCKVHMTHE